jgi:hypothetical protein
VLKDFQIEELLGLPAQLCTEPVEMANRLVLTIFPNQDRASHSVRSFAAQLKATLVGLGVTFLPFEQCLQESKKRLKKHISVLVLGEQSVENLPIEYVSSLSDNSIIQILDFPPEVSSESEFQQHFETSIALFAKHLVNIVLGADENRWILYNFNASHPIYSRSQGFAQAVLHSLIPKIFAPISPPKLSDFEIVSEPFDTNSARYAPYIEDLSQAAKLFAQTSLFPKGKSFDELNYISPYHRRIVKAHLDNRNGMSYGFLARQTAPNPEEDFDVLVLDDREIELPPLWVITQRSGSDKTHFVPERDLVKIGIFRGKLLLQAAQGADLGQDYRPSFDTLVILAHALGNHILASLFPKHHLFAKNYFKQGLGIAHWHGYFREDLLPGGYQTYGHSNPNVACSSPQSAFFALKGKLQCLSSVFLGDVHVEPQHGVNVTCLNLTDLARYLLAHPQASTLGNRYWKAHEELLRF